MALLSFGWVLPVLAAPTPKEVVTRFFELAFVQLTPTEAAMLYITPEKYIQHNPNGVDGRAAFIKGFAGYIERGQYRCVIHRVLADAYLVDVHNHCKEDPSNTADRGTAVVDMFRVENGMLVEHWDVEQAVPEKSQDTNAMF